MTVSGTVLVTGATGFIGRALVNRAALEGLQVRAAIRRSIANWPLQVDSALVGGLAPDTDWSAALKSARVVVHLAARVHVVHDAPGDALSEFRRVNVAGTLNLARQAVDAGVQRFVFVSSVKVNGERTPANRPYTARDVPAPVDPYGVSKYEAELDLTRLGEETGLEVVIVRPVLVYGPEVKANFMYLMRWLHRHIPLPLGAIHNRRSLIALDNLVDFILICVRHPMAANQTFLVSDGEDLSTTELIRRLADALERPARLFPVPPSLLVAGAALLGKRAVVQRLIGSLQVDISNTRELLDWMPPLSVDEGLRRTAEHFLRQRSRARTG